MVVLFAFLAVVSAMIVGAWYFVRKQRSKNELETQTERLNEMARAVYDLVVANADAAESKDFVTNVLVVLALRSEPGGGGLGLASELLLLAHMNREKEPLLADVIIGTIAAHGYFLGDGRPSLGA